MNAARAGRNVAGLAARRSGPSQAAVSRQQVVNKTTSSKGKGVVGGPKLETVTPPLPPKPQVTHETVTPPKGATGGGGGAASVPPEKKSGNLMIGAVLVGAVAASYYVTIHKMKDQDFLGDAEKEAAEEAQVNLHKSGLKVSSKVVPEQVEQAFNRASDAVSKAAEKAGTVAAEVKSAVENVAGAATEVKEEVAELKEEVEKVVEEKPKKKGWRKYILFGPRREG